MRPTKNDRAALLAMKNSMAQVLGAVAPDVRRHVYESLKNKSNSWQMRNAFGASELMDSTTVNALSDSVNDIRQRMISMRKKLWVPAQPFEGCVAKAGNLSTSLLRSNMITVMPSKATTQIYVFLGKTTDRLRPAEPPLNTRHFTVSPGYAHFVRKLGSGIYRKWVFLSGEPIASPFDGTVVWGLTTYDYATDTILQTYGGMCNGKFIARATITRCVNELRRIAAGAVYAAMRGESKDEED